MLNFDYLYNPEYYRDKIADNYFSNGKLHFKIIKNATYLPILFRKDNPAIGGVVDGYDNFVKGTFVHAGGGAYKINGEIPYLPINVIYIGMISATWGHAITDSISRLWFLKSDLYKEYFKNCPIVYGLANNYILPNFAKLLKILNLDINEWNLMNRPIQFQNMIVPDRSFGYSNETGGGGFTIKTTGC